MPSEQSLSENVVAFREGQQPTVHVTDVQPVPVQRGTRMVTEYRASCSCGWTFLQTFYVKSAAEDRANAHAAVEQHRGGSAAIAPDLIANVIDRLEVYAAVSAGDVPMHANAKRDYAERLTTAVLSLSGHGEGR